MTVLNTIETDVKTDIKDVESFLTADTLPYIKGAFTTKIDIFGATIPVNKKYFVKFVELASVAVLAVGLIGTQVYVYVDHKKAIDLNSARIGTVEAYQKQTDTNFVNVNTAITTTNKVVASVEAAEKADAAAIARLNAKLSPVRPTSAVTRKYFRKRR